MAKEVCLRLDENESHVDIDVSRVLLGNSSDVSLATLSLY